MVALLTQATNEQQQVMSMFGQLQDVPHDRGRIKLLLAATARAGAPPYVPSQHACFRRLPTAAGNGQVGRRGPINCKARTRSPTDC